MTGSDRGVDMRGEGDGAFRRGHGQPGSPSHVLRLFVGLDDDERQLLINTLDNYYVLVSGEVNNPGAFLAMPQTSLDRIVQAAGGLTPIVDLSGFEVSSAEIDNASGVSRTVRKTYTLRGRPILAGGSPAAGPGPLQQDFLGPRRRDDGIRRGALSRVLCHYAQRTAFLGTGACRWVDQCGISLWRDLPAPLGGGTGTRRAAARSRRPGQPAGRADERGHRQQDPDIRFRKFNTSTR